MSSTTNIPVSSVQSGHRAPRQRDRIRTIAIVNPTGAKVTSRRRAKDLVERGHAVYETKEGVIVGLRLLDHTVAQSLNDQYLSQHAEMVRERDITRMRSGVFPWNGSDRHPMSCHRPGEVRS